MQKIYFNENKVLFFPIWYGPVYLTYKVPSFSQKVATSWRGTQMWSFLWDCRVLAVAVNKFSLMKRILIAEFMYNLHTCHQDYLLMSLLKKSEVSWKMSWQSHKTGEFFSLIIKILLFPCFSLNDIHKEVIFTSCTTFPHVLFQTSYLTISNHFPSKFLRSSQSPKHYNTK